MPPNTFTCSYMSEAEASPRLEIPVNNHSFDLFVHLPHGSDKPSWSLRVIYGKANKVVSWSNAMLSATLLTPTTSPKGTKRRHYKITAGFDKTDSTMPSEATRIEVAEKAPVESGSFTDGDGELFLGMDSVMFNYDVSFNGIAI